MTEIRDAHEVLGVRKDASKDEVVKRYDILLRKHRALDEANDETARENFQEISKAYNILMGYEEVVPEMPGERKRPNPILKKLNVDEKKWDHFFYYYKVHVIVGIIAILVLVLSIKGCLERVDPDLSIQAIGNIYVSDDKKLQDSIKMQLSEVLHPSIDTLFMVDDKDPQQVEAYLMKIMAQMAAGEVDVYLFDKANFEQYAKQGAFVNLDETAAQLAIDKDQNKDYIVEAADVSGGAHLFGVRVTNSSILKDNGVIGDEIIAAIGVNTKHKVNAFKFLELLLK